MKRIGFGAMGTLLVGCCCLLLANRGWADDSNDRQGNSHQNQNTQADDSSRQPSDHRQQGSNDSDDTEYRGAEHAALGLMLSEREGQGVRIRDILPDSPAEDAGLRAGDRITKIDNKPMNSYRDVVRYVNQAQPGQKATVTVQRNGQEKTLHVQFAAREDVFENANQQSRGGNQNFNPNFGTRTYRGNQQAYNDQRNDNQQYANQNNRTGYYDDQSRGNSFRNEQWNSQARNDQRQRRWSNGGQSGRGVLGIDLGEQRGAPVVRGVWPNSPAQQAGLQRGDEIVAINGREVRDRDDVLDDLEGSQPGDRVTVSVSRNGRERDVPARLTSEQDLAQQIDRGWNRNSSANRNFNDEQSRGQNQNSYRTQRREFNQGDNDND